LKIVAGRGRLKAENRELRRTNAALKTASGFSRRSRTRIAKRVRLLNPHDPTSSWSGLLGRADLQSSL